MDGNQFDTLVYRFSRGEIGRRRLVIGALALVVGAPGATRLALAQDADPTPTPSSVQGQPGESRQQFPCPPGPTGPFNPNDWICGTGPFGPWYPVVAPPDITASTGIRWYGFQGLKGGGIEATAFGRAGDELGSYRAELDNGRLRWVLEAADAELQGVLEAPGTAGSGVELSGELNGRPFRLSVNQDGTVEPDPNQPIELDADQQRLLEQWQPAVERVDALLELALTTGQDPLEASDLGCFAAGYLLVATAPLCFLGGPACLPAGGATAYIAGKCTGSW